MKVGIKLLITEMKGANNSHAGDLTEYTRTFTHKGAYSRYDNLL